MLYNDPRDPRNPRNEPNFTRNELIHSGYFECPDCEELCQPGQQAYDCTSDEDLCSDCMGRREEICVEDHVHIEGGVIYLKGYPWKRVNEL